MKYLSTYKIFESNDKVYKHQDLIDVFNDINDILLGLEDDGFKVKREYNSRTSKVLKELKTFGSIIILIKKEKEHFILDDIKAYIYHFISQFNDSNIIESILLSAKNPNDTFSFRHPRNNNKKIEEYLESNGNNELRYVTIEIELLTSIKQL